jgi:pilus assembly protein Flp/PilA
MDEGRKRVGPGGAGRKRGRIGLRLVGRALGDERGATAVEYALIAGLIAAGVILVIGQLGDNVRGGFAAVQAEFDAWR